MEGENAIFDPVYGQVPAVLGLRLIFWWEVNI